MFVAARQIAPKVLALVGGAIDEGVDGLEPQGPQATLVAGLEPSGDLFGGPSFRKTIPDAIIESVSFGKGVIAVTQGASNDTENAMSDAFRKTIADESPQRRIFLEYGFTPPAQLIGSGGVKRRITPAGQGVAAQFPRYGGFRSLKRPGDGADRAAGRPHDGDLVSFLVQQM